MASMADKSFSRRGLGIPAEAGRSFSPGRLWALVKKEFLQIKRDSSTFLMGVVLPIILIIIMGFFLIRKAFTFNEMMECLPEGFKLMVPATLILTFAWTISGVTGSLGAAPFVAGVVESFGAGLQNFLPAVIFIIACLLAFATGSSWGTFGILIPIVTEVFPPLNGLPSPILMMAIGACLGGAVMGDHCSPISDTTIMASTGAQCHHINHVATQMPYAIVVAAVCFVSYIVAGFLPNVIIALPLALILMVLTLLVIGKMNGSLGKKKAKV